MNPVFASLICAFLALPHSGLSYGEQEWPHNIPAHIKYFPEQEARVRRDASIQRRMLHETPTAVRKMTPDAGEMFLLEYYGFTNRQTGWETTAMANSSTEMDVVQPAVLPHWDSQSQPLPAFVARDFRMVKRLFQCPAGTTSCDGINRPQACCPNGLTCNIVPNTGLGDVGCCNGNNCQGEVSSCEIGYTPCEAFGGGCCIPGYACASGGCILTATATVVITPTVAAQSISSSTPTTSSSSITTVSSSATPTCTSGFTSCPASLGGGCCATSMICGSSTACLPSPTSSAAASVVPPVRLTSATTATDPLTSIPPTATGSSCPTGFYACSAYYNPGACCQTGRDCGVTSCPPSVPTTLLESDGVAIVVTSGVAATATVPADAGVQQGSCATGWYACASSLGGNCCPQGFSCGTASCYLAATGLGAGETGMSEAKQSKGVRGFDARWVLLGWSTFGVMMAVL